MVGMVYDEKSLPIFQFGACILAGVCFVKHEKFISLHALKSNQNDGAVELQINGFRGLDSVGVYGDSLPQGTFS